MTSRALIPRSERVAQAVDLLTRERDSLANIETPADAAAVERRAAAIAELLRRADASDTVVNEATLLRVDALCLMATLVEQGQTAGQIATKGHPEQMSETRTFEDVGIDRRRYAEAKTLRDEGAAEWLRANLDGKRIAFHALVKQAARATREARGKTERQGQERRARRQLAKLSDADRCSLGTHDVHTWRPEGVDAIITDPPYVGDSIPLYRALRDFAVEVLPPGGALVVMAWQPILPDVFAALAHDQLAYRWALCWHYATHENTVDHARRVFDSWKPVLVYHRDAMPRKAPMFHDVVESVGADKDHHEWGQSVDGFATLVERFTLPGQLVCDPFLGGGTTAVAALTQTRRFVGGDVDAAAVRTTRRRLGQVQR